MSRKDKIDELLQAELAMAISDEIPMENGLITVSYVDCSPELSNAKVAISVIPDNLTGTALRNLKRKTSVIAGRLKKKTRLRKIPKIEWIVDSTEKEAAKIEELFKQIHEEENNID